MRDILGGIQRWLAARRARRITLSGAIKRVNRGAAYLDEVDPAWHERIDPETLELRSGESCVLGQLHGEFRLGLRRSHLFHCSSAPRANLSPISYGFFCAKDVSEELQERDYDYLNEAWRLAIWKRRRQGESVPSEAALLEDA